MDYTSSIDRLWGECEWNAEVDDDVRDGHFLCKQKLLVIIKKPLIHGRRRRVEGQTSIQTIFSHDNDSKLLR